MVGRMMRTFNCFRVSLNLAKDGPKFQHSLKEELKITLKIGSRFIYNKIGDRFKSLIHKIYKDGDDDDIEEIQAIREYLKKQ